MQIKKVSRFEYGSCNHCDIASFDEKENKLKYPYSEVYLISFKTVSIRLCLNCLKKLSWALNGQIK